VIPDKEHSDSSSAAARQSLAAFLRRNRNRALAEWERTVRGVPAAALLDARELLDHIPSLIDRVLGLVEAGVTETTSLVGEIPDLHAVERMQEGFSLEQIAWEYLALRSTLLRLNAAEGSKLEPDALVVLNDAIDQALVRGIDKYHRARVRTLEALDQIAHEGLGPEPQALDALLHRLLRVILHTAEAVDTAVIYLRYWDQLVLRAAVGLEQELEGRFSVAVGEGFAGTVAATKQPLFTPSAQSDPRVKNDLLRMTRVRALYGVPLVYGDEVIGVMKMGSRTASDFAADDRQILRITAERAAAFIARQRIAEERELFLHILGHDLRSPLSTIVVGAALLARRDSLSPSDTRTVERMVVASQRMERVIGDLADYTKTRATGTLPLDREKVNLHELVRQLAAELQAQTADRELRLELTGDAVGEWDRGGLLRLISNLVNNAVAYGARSTPVTIAVEASGDSVMLRVHNEGDSIPKALLPHLFEPFRRGRTGTGVGLGLYIVQQIARAHGGGIDVDSAPGCGTTFRVNLPRRAS
jgi:signal transduction histidine kinase